MTRPINSTSTKPPNLQYVRLRVRVRVRVRVGVCVCQWRAVCHSVGCVLMGLPQCFGVKAFPAVVCVVVTAVVVPCCVLFALEMPVGRAPPL